MIEQLQIYSQKKGLHWNRFYPKSIQTRNTVTPLLYCVDDCVDDDSYKIIILPQPSGLTFHICQQIFPVLVLDSACLAFLSALVLLVDSSFRLAHYSLFPESQTSEHASFWGLQHRFIDIPSLLVLLIIALHHRTKFVTNDQSLFTDGSRQSTRFFV